MGILSNIEPKEVFQYFEELSMVPRSTFHTKKISDFCVEFAKAHNLEYIQDEMNNVIIKKPGTAGYEDSDPVIIQGHLDMVATKTTDSDHDFENDPLDLFVDGDLIGAKNTTLGGDDGIKAQVGQVGAIPDRIAPALLRQTGEDGEIEGVAVVKAQRFERSAVADKAQRKAEKVLGHAAERTEGGVVHRLRLPG